LIKIGGFIVVACLVAIPAHAEETPRHSIAVAGESELLLPPDYATITVGVVTQAPQVANALAENSERMTRVIAAIKSVGVLDKDIQTSIFRIRPKYEKTARVTIRTKHSERLLVTPYQMKSLSPPEI
jgi:uncharacterized protein